MSERENNQQHEQREVQIAVCENRKYNLVHSILLVVLIIVLIFMPRCHCCHCCCGHESGHGNSCVTDTHNPPSTTTPNASIGTVTDPTVPDEDPNAGDYVKPTTPEVDGVAIPGWGRLTIPANTSQNITVDFFNPEANADKYYLTFELRIPANNEQGYEVLYKSGLIAPGLHIQSINLNRGLPAGTYNAILHVQPYRIADKSLTNNADLKLELVAK